MNKKIITTLHLLLLPLFFGSMEAQHYWQQSAKYDMEIDFDHRKHRFSGTQKIWYKNNSPDTLNTVFYHLFYNAFQPGSNMDMRSQLIPDPDRRVKNRISKLKNNEIGFQEIKTLTQNGQLVKWEEWETILKVSLNKPLLPGDSSLFEMEFQAQVPVQIRRTGRFNEEDVHYSMAQWYPKMAEYDRHGWNTTPYVGREFYGVWADFDVRIKIDPTYILAGTGILQNPEDIGYGYSEGLEKPKTENGKALWHFRADSVHDFVWAADPDYTHTTRQVPNGPLMRFFYKEKDNKHVENWQKLPEYMEKFFQLTEELVGAYPYAEFSFIQGGDGGMEYPMATLMLGRGEIRGMTGLAVHEALHNWFYGMIATNEARYPWMDEGFTSFVENIIMAELFPREDEKRFNPHLRNYLSYVAVFQDKKTEPLSTPADHYSTNRAYGIASYSQGALFLSNLEYIMGEEVFWPAFRRFFREWKFKHPHPDDFIRVMERESGLQLHWFLDLWTGTKQHIHYEIDTVQARKKKTELKIRRKGELPMPISFVVVSKDGERTYYNIPLDLMYGRKQVDGVQLPMWKWTHETYIALLDIPLKEIDRIYIDPKHQMSDISRKGHRWPQSQE